MNVVEQQAQQTADHDQREHLNLRFVGDQEEEKVGRYGHIDQQSVQTIGKVDRIRRAYNEQQHDNDIDADRQVKLEPVEKRDITCQREGLEQDIQ